jgi:hypothetical protein
MILINRKNHGSRDSNRDPQMRFEYFSALSSNFSPNHIELILRRD